MWNFERPGFRRRKVNDEPIVKDFLDGVVFSRASLLDPRSPVLSRWSMGMIPLIEWEVSRDTDALFSFLANSGAIRGFFVALPRDGRRDTDFWECDLDANSASVVRDERLLDFDTIFIDDQMFSVIAGGYTDFALWCMRRDLFDRYLDTHPVDMRLSDDRPERLANNFRSALVGALERLDDWDRMGSDAGSIKPGFSWQLSEAR